jgi:hypothetical protein
VVVGVLVLANPPQTEGAGAAVTLASEPTASPAALAAMSAAVSRGLETKAVPRNLDPSLLTASGDFPLAGNVGCLASFAATVNQGPCAFGDLHAARTVVLFGDSHAIQWLPAVVQAALVTHWKVVVWGKSACSVADLTVWNQPLSQVYTSCDEWRTLTVARIVALHPALIIASQSDNVGGSVVTNGVWASHTVTTLRMLAAGGSKVDFILDVPYNAQDVPDCVAAHLSDVAPCNIRPGQLYVYPGRLQAVARAVRAAGFPVVDPATVMCAASGCPVIVGNLLAYRDNGHITATFSRWLTPFILPLLTRATPRVTKA